MTFMNPKSTRRFAKLVFGTNDENSAQGPVYPYALFAA